MELPERIESYLDAVSRATMRVEEVGPFSLFLGGAGHPGCARPRPGVPGGIGPADLAEVMSRQRRLGLPEAVEWTAEVAPGLAAVAGAAGLEVDHRPLMVIRSPVVPDPPAGGYRVGLVGAEDPVLPVVRAVVDVAFSPAGPGPATAGVAERDGAAFPGPGDELARERMRDGRLVVAAAYGPDGPVAAGIHSPLGGMSEITGVATLPAFRRRGLGGAVTAFLAADAVTRGSLVCFICAGSPAAARLYRRIGFARVATAGCARPAAAGATGCRRGPGPA